MIRAGRRGGKTIGMAIYAIGQFREGRRMLYAAPTQEQIDAFWSEVKRSMIELIDAKLIYQNETRHILDGTHKGVGGRIRAKTAWNADTLRGDYADTLILDEFQLMEETAWTEVGVPMLLDNNGDAIFIYTPPSRTSRSASKARDPRYAAKLFKQAQEDKTGRWEAFHFTSHDNPHISQDALEDIAQDMTSLAYRQEILAEDIDEVPGALWTRKLIDDTRLNSLPDAPTTKNPIPLKRIVVAIDPAATSGPSSDETGIIVCGIGTDNKGYVLEDATVTSASPDIWANTAINAYERWDADRIIAETNNGGDMIEHTLRVYAPDIPYTRVHAKRGKALRAEPVSALYERQRVHHVGLFPDLEDQMCEWVPGLTTESPDRLDALVYALTDLMVTSAPIKRKRLVGF